jgi:hypothetical protein
VLAAGQGLPQLPPEPSHQADSGLIHRAFLYGRDPSYTRQR